MSDSSGGFTGRRRDRKTRRAVVVLDKVSGALITVGGLGTIVAVLGVCLFLAAVVVPLFTGAETEPESVVPARSADVGAPRHVAVDEYGLMAWSLHDGGVLRLTRLDDGRVLQERRLFEGRELTALSLPVRGDEIAFGFADGTVTTAVVGFATRFFEPDVAPGALGSLEAGEVAEHEGGLAQLTPERQVRLQQLEVELAEPVPTGTDAAIQLLDHVVASSGTVYVAVDDASRVWYTRVKLRRNLLTGKTTARSEAVQLPQPPARAARPVDIVVAGLGSSLCLAWEDGHVVRYDVRDTDAPRIAEELDVLDGAERLTVFRPLLGRGTLLVGDASGGLSAWFLAMLEGAESTDGSALVRAHDLPRADGAITAVGSSSRSRMVAVGDETGGVRVVHVTTQQLLSAVVVDGAGPITALAIAPKDDGFVAATTEVVQTWTFDPAYPEATVASLIRPVWYEGYPEPTHVWQSSSATDDFEMKLGLWPLVFGTLKATVYSMLFGAPVALLAAIYTSQFLSRSASARIKPTIELMASLPSVVLGFLAALVIAPWVENRLVPVLASFYIVPLAVLAGAYLWQLLPQGLALRFSALRLWGCLAMVPVGVLLAVALSPTVERLLFAGDVKLWLDGQTGSGTGGWILVLLPMSAIAVAVALTRFVDPWLRSVKDVRSKPHAAVLDGIKFAVALGATLVVAYLGSLLFSSLGFDPRGLHLGTYVQRNAMVVGFAMGFAVIPIIYTIADDALCSVPEHLRSASLGCGATPWQTAVRVIIPTAMSGLFSALMVGLGRAVGETMIVLMAAGNTPVTDWNIFNGFRTLSANIAVELPEAVRGSTHYRTLFLAALTLFVMTFVVNTAAESIRLRFRKKAYEA